jgi:enamine deaminase RidA (YjgF/YER057c/UK114 family)
MTFLEKLAALKIDMPNAPEPVANYINVKQIGSQIIVSGQLSTKNGVLIKGQMGDGTTIEDGYEAAKYSTLNIFAQLQKAGINLDKIECVRLGVFIASAPNFFGHSKIANGASDFMIEMLGEKGKHTRVAVGVAALPLGALIEIESIFIL